MKNELGQLVRLKRKQAGLTQAQLAQLIRRPISWVYQVESGRMPLSYFHTGQRRVVTVVTALAKALHIHLNILVQAIRQPLPRQPGPKKFGMGEKPCPTDLGKFIRERRHRLQLNQMELSILCKLAGTIQAIEQGRVQRLNSGTITRLAKGLGYQPDEIVKLCAPWPRRGSHPGSHLTASNHGLGKLIRARRLALNLNQTKLAEAIGVTRQAISSLEIGRQTKGSQIKEGKLRTIAAVLKINPEVLLAARPTRVINKTRQRADVFGRLLTDHRQTLGLSQHQLAKRLGIVSTTLCNWERGKHMPPIRRLVSIASILKIEEAELIRVLFARHPS